MHILDKYILTKIVKGYILLIAVFLGLYVIIDLFSHLGEFLKNKIPFYLILNYYIYNFPFMFLKVSPFSLLISTIHAFGELNKNNEILGMRVLGVSIFKLSFPAIALALLVSVFSLFIQEKILISSQEKIEDIKVRFIKKDYKQKNNLAFKVNDMIFFVAEFLPKKKIMKDVVIFKEDKEGYITDKMVVKKIVYINKKWIAYDVVTYKLDKSSNFFGNPIYKDQILVDIQESPENLIAKRTLFSEFTPIKTLKYQRKRLMKIGAFQHALKVTIELQRKIAEPFSHLFLILGALPFALEIRKRKVALSSLGLGFILGFIYYVTFSITLALGKAEIILPCFASWTAPLFFLIIGISGLLLIR